MSKSYVRAMQREVRQAGRDVAQCKVVPLSQMVTDLLCFPNVICNTYGNEKGFLLSLLLTVRKRPWGLPWSDGTSDQLGSIATKKKLKKKPRVESEKPLGSLMLFPLGFQTTYPHSIPLALDP